MDKNAIKKYAVWARRELISRVTQRALKYGISEKEIIPAKETSIHGVALSPTEIAQRTALISQINNKGFEQVMEEVAYTWFNRFSALRFMEVNGYLPTHVRVFTDDENNFKPQIMAEAINLEMDGLDMEKVYAMKDANDNDALFKYLIITQCNALSSILPGMFQKIDDYTELLFPDNLLREGSAIEQMISLVPEDDWKDQVQIIGWLYQYYNTETFNEIYDGDMSRKKIEKNLLPAATQMFTPDWVVRYMVENSLGRLWLDGHNDEKLKHKWKFFLEEVDQDEQIGAKVKAFREDCEKLTPDQIKCIDPCSGSGHICVYLFDVLIQIYESYGYSSREAVISIVKNNIYGLDIDCRAVQLAYFGVMMKARQYDRGFFRRGIQPNIYVTQGSNQLNKEALEYFCDGRQELVFAIKSLTDDLYDAGEYGSILKVEQVDFPILYARIEEIRADIHLLRDDVLNNVLPFIQCAEVMAQKYDVAVTNPPYLNSSRMSEKMNKYVKKHFPGSRFDLCMVMYEAMAKNYVKECRYLSLVTTTSWMFISSFEEVRRYAVNNLDFQSIVDFGTELFEGKIGHLPITAWVNIKMHTGKKFKAVRLVEYCYSNRGDKQIGFFEEKNHYYVDEQWFSIIEGNPLCYWISPEQIKAFQDNPSFVTVSPPRTGMMTTDNNRFLREWYEVDFHNISLDSKNIEESVLSEKKWFPYNKGGDFQRWYGNRDLIVNWENAGKDIADNGMTSFRGKDFYFREGLTWTIFGYDNFAVRYSPVGAIFDIGGTSTFPPQKLLYYILGYLNSKVASDFITLINPTVNIQNGDVKRLPLKMNDEAVGFISNLVKCNVSLVKEDYDSSEISWDFISHPLISENRKNNEGNMEVICKKYLGILNERFRYLKSNEQSANEYFARLYGVEKITIVEVPERKVSINMKSKEELVIEFISYAVGCMFGRYSVYHEGLIFAGGVTYTPFDGHSKCMV